MGVEQISWLETLRRRIEFVLPATTNPTQHIVFREWLALCDAIKKEHEEDVARHRREAGRVYQDRHAAQQLLRKLGCHEDGCEAVRVIGRFGSRSGLRWSEGDEKKCNCGFKEGFQIHESGERPRPYS